MRIYSLYLICFTFGIVLIALLVRARRNDEIALRMWLFSISVAGWALPTAIFMNEYNSLHLTEILMRSGHVFAVFIPVAWIHFVLSFIGRKEPFNYFYRLLYSYSFVMLCLIPFDFFMRPAPDVGVRVYAVLAGPLYIFYTIYFFAIVLLGFVYLVFEFKIAVGQRRAQIKFLLLATGFGYVGGGSVFFAIYEINEPIVLMALTPFYPVFMGISLVKYGMFAEEDVAKAAHKDKLAAIGTLVTSINHEIKNPLYVIQGLAQSFRQNKAENLYGDKDKTIDAAEEVMAKSEAQIQRAVEIMKNFSFFAKQGIDNDVELKGISPVNVVARLLPLISYELQLDKIKVINFISDDSSEVKADERYLEEILFNLIMNSCQAMKQSGGELTLSAKEANDKVIIEIKDNGPGINKEAQKQIFEPFYTTKEEGTGLGLYITKQLVEKIGGKISIESKDGKGAAFRLELNKA